MKKHELKIKKNGQIVGSTKRRLYSEQVGNFNPIYCRYNGRRYLVRSELGDISDPFRRTPEYLNSLYIEEEFSCPI